MHRKKTFKQKRKETDQEIFLTSTRPFDNCYNKFKENILPTHQLTIQKQQSTQQNYKQKCLQDFIQLYE